MVLGPDFSLLWSEVGTEGMVGMVVVVVVVDKDKAIQP